MAAQLGTIHKWCHAGEGGRGVAKTWQTLLIGCVNAWQKGGGGPKKWKFCVTSFMDGPLFIPTAYCAYHSENLINNTSCTIAAIGMIPDSCLNLFRVDTFKFANSHIYNRSSPSEVRVTKASISGDRFWKIFVYNLIASHLRKPNLRNIGWKLSQPVTRDRSLNCR